MAQRRMFSLKIVGSDAFLEMPTSARELYFQLGMYADDDGFVNPRKIMRMIGSSEDDIKVLIGKRFVLPFDNGVVVIKHWLINNLVRKDFYQETMYLDQKKTLQIKDNKAYTENVNNLLPQDRIGKERITGVAVTPQKFTIEKEESAQTPKTPPKYPHAIEVFEWFPSPQPSWRINTTELKHAELLYVRGESAVKKRLRYLEENKDEDFLPTVLKPSDLERKWLDIEAYAKRNR